MPSTTHDIRKYQEQFVVYDLSAMSTSEYRKVLGSGAFIWIDHHHHGKSTLSNEVLATNYEQVDVGIQRPQELRGRMAIPPD